MKPAHSQFPICDLRLSESSGRGAGRVSSSLSLRERERVRVRATKIFAVLECAGVSPSPRPSPAGRGGIVRCMASPGGPRVVVAHERIIQGPDEAGPSTNCRLWGDGFGPEPGPVREGVEKSGASRKRFPLPQGEGKGEGEGNEDFRGRRMCGCVSLTPALSRWERGNRPVHGFPWRATRCRGPVFQGPDGAGPSTAHEYQGRDEARPSN